MRVTRVDMFGTAPGRGSALDVLLPEPGHPCEEKVAAHARATDADETALVTSCVERTFATRIFNAEGETSPGTHSLAGVAACLVTSGHLTAGDVERTDTAGHDRLWTDGHQVHVPFDGPAVHVEIVGDTEESRPCRSYVAGVGRGFRLVRVPEDPRALPRPDLDLGTSNLTFFRWDPDDRRMLARVFAPGFGIPEDAACLPVAAALMIAAQRLDPGGPVTVTQVTARGTDSVFTCQGTILAGAARLTVSGQVWVSDRDFEGVKKCA